MFLTLLRHRTNQFWIKRDGIWKQTWAWLKISGEWKRATVWRNDNGIWKIM